MANTLRRLGECPRSATEGSVVVQYRLTRIEAPDWATQPDFDVGGVTVAEYSELQRHRDELLRIVHQEIENYLNTPGLWGEGEGFPDRLRMTGTYYIAAESYFAHRDPVWWQISFKCHCLEHPKAGIERDDDYLGLEVWIKYTPTLLPSFEVFRNTDSSSI
ncbi:MAG: hypothetical protein ACK49R_08515 [Planctomycetota bacterium]|jgi:hypothetical protein